MLVMRMAAKMQFTAGNHPVFQEMELFIYVSDVYLHTAGQPPWYRGSNVLSF